MADQSSLEALLVNAETMAQILTVGQKVRIVTQVKRATSARIEHEYLVYRAGDDQVLVEGSSTIACVDETGNIRRMPEFLIEAH